MPDASHAPVLIIHADDLGESVEISRGILECADAGMVTSTSMLANMPGTELALVEAKRRGRQISFGVHLNLCEGPALTGASSLTDRAGTFRPKRVQALRAFAGLLVPRDLDAELRAQVDRVRQAGVAVSHLDSHKHLHQLPGVAAATLRVARACGIERVRCTLEAGVWPAGTRLLPGLSRLVRRGLAGRFRARLAPAGVRSPARTFDLAEVMRRAPATRVALLAGSGGAIAEMFCHPGTPAADREKPGSTARAAESTYLRSPEFRELLRAAGVRLATYWEV